MKTSLLASLLFAAFISAPSPCAAGEPPATTPPQAHSFRLLAAADGTPIAGAKVIVSPAMGRPLGNWPGHTSIDLPRDPIAGQFTPPRSPAEVGPPAPEPPLPVSDAEGRVTLAVPAVAATLIVINGQGIAYVHEGQWAQGGGDVHANLQAWASLSGTVTMGGKPAPGVRLQLSRSYASESIGSMVSIYTPPVCHRTEVRSDADGHFKIDHLLPTALDGSHDVAYLVEQAMPAEPATTPQDADIVQPVGLAIRSGPWSMTLGHGDLAFAPGEHRDLEIAATPPCERTVSGRLIWTDGKPLQLADFKDPAMTVEPRLQFYPQNFRNFAGSLPGSTLDAEGRFHVSVPIAGKWKLETERLRPLTAAPFGYEFTLPETPDAHGQAGPADLGDIVFQKPGHAAATPPAPDQHGQVEVAFTVLDEQRHPLPGAAVNVFHLDSRDKSSSRYLYSKDFPSVRTDAAGLARIKLPVTFREENGKDWPISGAELEITHEGCEPLQHTFTFGEQGAVLALRTAASISARVEKDGDTLPAAQVVMRVGWTHGADCFEHGKWMPARGGTFVRDLVPPGTWQIQAGHLDAEKWRWFSEIVEVPAPGQKAPAALTLRRGTRVAGTLPAEIPRPVKRGIVRVVVRTPPPSGPSASPIFWSDWQTVDESGAFAFRGLPPGDAWIAAACDGWISAPAATARAKRLPGDPNWGDPISMHWTAVPFHVDAADTSVSVPMIRTGAVLFRFKHADGTPVAGARPYIDAHITLGPASETLASTERALDQMLGDPDNNGYRPAEFLPRPPQETDATGTLRLDNLPPTHLRVGLHADREQLSPADPTIIPSDHMHDLYAPFQADIKSGEVVEKDFVVTSSKTETGK